MRTLRWSALAAAVLVGALCAAVPAAVLAGEASFAQENSPENLQQLFRAIRAARDAGDTATAAALTRGVLPNAARLKKALRDDVPTETVEKILAFYARVASPEDEKLAALLATRPERTEVAVHGATTEEIAASAQGSAVLDEFPGGAVRLAEEDGGILRAGVTFYEVELLEPGRDRGMKYHLFYWDGERWTMLGPAWRALR
jgi:hypothetical protein